MESRQAWRVREFLESFRIGRTKFYRMVADGEIRVLKSGRTTLVPRAAVEAWVASCEAEAARTFGKRRSVR